MLGQHEELLSLGSRRGCCCWSFPSPRRYGTGGRLRRSLRGIRSDTPPTTRPGVLSCLHLLMFWLSTSTWFAMWLRFVLEINPVSPSYLYGCSSGKAYTTGVAIEASGKITTTTTTVTMTTTTTTATAGSMNYVICPLISSSILVFFHHHR